METTIFRQLLKVFMEYQGIGFVSLTYRAINGEVSKRLLNVNSKYSNAKEKDLKILASGIDYISSPLYSKQDWDIALTKINLSLKTPDKFLSDVQNNAYVYVNQNSIKYNFNKQKIYLFAKSVNKTIIQPVLIKPVKSEPITIARHMIEDTYLKTSTFRLFILENVCGTVKMNGETLEIDVANVNPELF